ncbi:hypothetical protein FGB62_169g08 [Gracilaria domingensis]|nr:hypothetical protein FGB62_169g08 [Gracilaria domingensis]
MTEATETTAATEMSMDGTETVEMEPVPLPVDAREDLDEPMPTAEESEPACFPADAAVRTAHGVKRMADVNIGDLVATADGLFSRVFAFTHRQQRVRASFVVLRAGNGLQLALSGGHYLYANGRVVAADEVAVGDVLRTERGDSAVVSVSHEMRVGLYNAQTESGQIVVDGVVATTYTRAVDVRVAHALLTPLRAMFGSLGARRAAERSTPDLPLADARLCDFALWRANVLAMVHHHSQGDAARRQRCADRVVGHGEAARRAGRFGDIA